MSQNDHMAAILTRANTAATPRSAYSIDKVPPEFDFDTGIGYLELTLSRRFGGNARNGGGKTPAGYRLTARAVSKSVANTALMLEKFRAGFENTFLAITAASEIAGPFLFETEDPVGQDEADVYLYTGLQSFTYVSARST